MTKTDDLLLELRRAFAAFLNSFFSFEYENKTYRLVNNYVVSPWTRCDVCGNHPIKDVSVIRGNDGQKLRVGNRCIDHLINRKVSEWFKKFRTKRNNIIKNRRYIDCLASILAAYKRSELLFQMSGNDVKRVEKAFERMCSGFNLTRKQEQLAECYISLNARTYRCT